MNIVSVWGTALTGTLRYVYVTLSPTEKQELGEPLSFAKAF
jgi:hypothetical protein